MVKYGYPTTDDTKENGYKAVIDREVAAFIVDAFEDFLTDKGIDIPNPEKEGDKGEAIIYGSDFDWIMDKVQDALAAAGIYTPDTYDEVGKPMLSHKEVLDTLSETIETLDSAKQYGQGDRVLDVLSSLRMEWGLELEEEEEPEIAD